MAAGEEVLGALLDPFDRARELAGQIRDDDLLGKGGDLLTEAAPDVWLDDPYGRLRDTERLGQEDPERVGILGGGPDRQLLRVGVPRGGVGPGLDRRGHVPLRLRDAADDALARGPQHPAGVALGELLVDHHVVAPRRLDERAAPLEGRLGLVHHGKLLVHDVDEVERPMRGVTVLRHDDRNGLADVAGAVGRQRANGKALTAVEARVGCGRDRVRLAGDLLTGQHVEHAGLGHRPRGFDRKDAGGGVRAPQHGHRAHLRQRDVRNERPVPAHELAVRQAGYPASHVLHRRNPSFACITPWPGPRPGSTRR